MSNNWTSKAACKDELDMLAPTSQRQLEVALSLCAACAVIQQCRKLADETPQKNGVWAGNYYSNNKNHGQTLPKPGRPKSL